MAKTKSTPICNFTGCNKLCTPSGYHHWSRFCSFHKYRATTTKYIGLVYARMYRRVRGVGGTKRPDLYTGLPIIPKDIFIVWAKNHPDFLSLYKRWFTNDFDRRLTPTVNRMNSSKGYVLGNMEWMTNSQNCGLSAGVKRMKQKKAIYELLGVNK